MLEKCFSHSGSCDGETSLIAFALYFLPFYLVSTVLICLQQVTLTLPLPPCNWIYAAISFSLLVRGSVVCSSTSHIPIDSSFLKNKKVAVVVPLGAGPKVYTHTERRETPK